VNLHWTFTTRKGGVSTPPFSAFNLGSHVGDDPAAVAANRRELLAQTGVDAVVWMDQVHSATVAVVDGPRADPVPATDGLVTAVPGLALAVLVADCVPILAGDPDSGVVGVAHAGRVGAADGIGLRLLEQMAEQGAERDRITVVLGPAICGRCYEVPAAMQAAVAGRLPGSAVETASGTPGLDLRVGLEAQLAGAGLGRVQRSVRCTFEDTELFSHRRQAPTGRQAGVIWFG